MCSVDLEPCSVWQESPVGAARKAHECDSCGGRIEAGSPYVKHFSVFEGDATHEKICAPCGAARKAFEEAHGQVGVPSRFAEMLRDCYAETPRKFWEEDDRFWRSLYAGVLMRNAGRTFGLVQKTNPPEDR